LRFQIQQRSALLMAAAGGLLAQGPSGLQVAGTSATQAVLHYQTPDSNPCQVQISPNASMTPLAADVDPALFTAANQDNRPGSASNSPTDRYFVAGKRRSDVALDGLRHSRALQAFTLYYVSVNCDGTAATTQFTTANPPLGNNYPEPPPFDATAFGNYAWPSIDWNDQSKTYIDPLTGIALMRASGPGWFGGSQAGKAFGTAIDLNGKWTSVANVLSGNNTTLASYSGAGGDSIFVALDPAQLTGLGGGQLSSWTPVQSLDGMLIRVFGTGNGVILGCLSVDSGQNCLSATFTLATLGPRGGNPAGTYPATACTSDTSKNCFPNNGFWGGWNVTPVNGQMGGVTGPVNVSGTAVTTSNQNLLFNLNWKPGGKVLIAGSAPGCSNNLCTIAAVNSSSSMTIQENAGTLNGANFKTANSGVKLWVAPSRTEARPASGTLTANISLNFDYAYSDDMTMPIASFVSQCSPVPTTVSYAADGVTPITPVPGQLCLAAHTTNPSKVLYLLIPSTGETRLLAPIWLVNSSDAPADQVKDPLGGNIAVPNAAFDATDANTIYAQVNTNGGVSIFRGVYNAAANRYKAYAHSLYPNQTAGYAPGQNTTQPWYRGPAWTDTGITWTNITKASQGLDLGSQIAAKDSTFSGNLFGGPTLTEIAQGQAFTVNSPASFGESLSLIHSFNLSTGALADSADTWSTFPDRWCAMHTNEDLLGWFGLVCNPLGGTYGFKGNPGVMGIGPWQTTPTAMLKNGSFSPDTSITATAPKDACPAIPPFLQALVPANPRCVTFQSRMACSLTPFPGENVKWPCEYNPSYSELEPLAPGDNILMVNGTANPESLMILSVTSLGSAMYQFTAVRFGTSAGGVGTYSSAPNGWTGYAMPPSTTCNFPTCTPGVGLWFDGTQSSVTWQLDPAAFAGHSDLGNAPAPGANSFCQSQSCRYNIPFARQLGAPLNLTFRDGSFQGVGGEITLQGYPSLRQLTAPPSQQVWMTNFRHLNPSYGAGAEVASAVGGVSYSLVAGTQGVFKFTAINGGVSYKQVPVEGYAGYHLLQDASSAAQGNTITDTTPWQFCVVLKAGECRTGSKPGEAYASVPQGAVSSMQNCISNWYDDNFPCLFTPPAQAAWAIQQGIAQNDPAGHYWRPITMGFSGPGRQFEFGTFIPDPTGTWAFMQGYWPDGVRNELFMARLPPWPTQSDSINRSNYVSLPVSVAANSSQPLARVHFGYAENGTPSSFYCTARKDACTASGTPFSFDSENPKWQNCANGCSIQVPEIAGRVLYYETDRQDASGNTTPGPLHVNILP
jgi:hypothetical protein